MPGDTIGFDIRVYNTGTRAATGLIVTDLIPVGTTYPVALANGAQAILNFVTGSVVGDMDGLFAWGGTATQPSVQAIDIPARINATTPSFLTIHITGVLVTQTGVDVGANYPKTNTGRVEDPTS